MGKYEGDTSSTTDGVVTPIENAYPIISVAGVRELERRLAAAVSVLERYADQENWVIEQSPDRMSIRSYCLLGPGAARLAIARISDTPQQEGPTNVQA